MAGRPLTQVQLVNGSTGDPLLYLDYHGQNNALLFDAGDTARLTMAQLADLEAVFITHHHIDHFVGLDRIIRANLDRDKTLHIFGPVQSILRIYDRVKSYEYPFFPFMKLWIEVHELHEGRQRMGRMGCETRFAPPTLTEEPWNGPVCYRTRHLKIEAIPVTHTVPCWAYAMTERAGWQVDPAKLHASLLKPGPWLTEARELLRTGASLQTPLSIHGGTFPLHAVRDLAFSEAASTRIVYITDTLYAEALQPQLVKLARGADLLFCDSFYGKNQAKDAAKHHHMMAWQAAELAQAAKVKQLVLIHHASRYAGQYHRLLEEAAAIFPRVRHEVD